MSNKKNFIITFFIIFINILFNNLIAQNNNSSEISNIIFQQLKPINSLVNGIMDEINQQKEINDTNSQEIIIYLKSIIENLNNFKWPENLDKNIDKNFINIQNQLNNFHNKINNVESQLNTINNQLLSNEKNNNIDNLKKLQQQIIEINKSVNNLFNINEQFNEKYIKIQDTLNILVNNINLLIKKFNNHFNHQNNQNSIIKKKDKKLNGTILSIISIILNIIVLIIIIIKKF
jgi:hypothetical protein